MNDRLNIKTETLEKKENVAEGSVSNEDNKHFSTILENIKVETKECEEDENTQEIGQKFDNSWCSFPEPDNYKNTSVKNEVFIKTEKNYDIECKDEISNNRDRNIKKTFNDFNCHCVKDCYNRISESSRKDCFEKYWSLGDYIAETVFIGNLVREDLKKRQYGSNAEKRQFTRSYHLNDVEVCRDMFIKTLGISSKRVNTALSKLRSANFSEKVTNSQRLEVINQISKTPSFKHELTDIKTLPADTTLRNMFNLYLGEVDDPVSFTTYRSIFLSSLGIKCELPKGTCPKYFKTKYFFKGYLPDGSSTSDMNAGSEILFDVHENIKPENEEEMHNVNNEKKRKYSEVDNELYFDSDNGCHDTEQSEKKKFRNYDCGCLRKCFTKLTETSRREFFDKFWELNDYQAETLYIANLVCENPKKNQYGINNEKRQFTRVYRIGDVEVCRDMFVKTLGISSKRIHTVLSRVRTSSMLDQEGKFIGGRNKITEDKKRDVIDHINKILEPENNSSISEGRPRKITLQKMYNMYVKEVKNPMSISSYRSILISNFDFKNQTRNSFQENKRAIADYENIIELNQDNSNNEPMKNEFVNTSNQTKFLECPTFDLVSLSSPYH